MGFFLILLWTTAISNVLDQRPRLDWESNAMARGMKGDTIKKWYRKAPNTELHLQASESAASLMWEETNLFIKFRTQGCWQQQRALQRSCSPLPFKQSGCIFYVDKCNLVLPPNEVKEFESFLWKILTLNKNWTFQ